MHIARNMRNAWQMDVQIVLSILLGIYALILQWYITKMTSKITKGYKSCVQWTSTNGHYGPL